MAWVLSLWPGIFEVRSGVITWYLVPDPAWFYLFSIMGDIITCFAVPQFVKCSLRVMCPVGDVI